MPRFSANTLRVYDVATVATDFCRTVNGTSALELETAQNDCPHFASGIYGENK
jgi:hypothetical protein